MTCSSSLSELGLVLLALSAAVGCTDAHGSAASSAPPAIRIPVGPVPGPPQERALPQNPYYRDAVALQEGRTLFVRYNCAGCHGDYGGGGMGPSLRDADWLYGKTDGHVFDSIAEGRGQGMPAWGTKIPEQQVWKLVGYVLSMRTELEPVRPNPTIPPPPMQ
jgi:cytochrome c oxidase cbb3-type subunit 3